MRDHKHVPTGPEGWIPVAEISVDVINGLVESRMCDAVNYFFVLIHGVSFVWWVCLGWR